MYFALVYLFGKVTQYARMACEYYDFF